MTDQHRYRTILLFGMPGSGKGTQGSVLGQLPDLVHVSMGDVFRKIPKDGHFGQEIARYTSKGLLVPDDLTVRIWERHIQIVEMQELLLPEQHTLILDGIPRNYAQAERLDSLLDVIQIFHLVINDTVKASERLDNPWLRALIISPNVHHFLTTLVLGTKDLTTLAALIVKPSSSVMMTFTSDPSVGLTPDRFSGSAIAFLPTITYETATARTAGLQ